MLDQLQLGRTVEAVLLIAYRHLVGVPRTHILREAVTAHSSDRVLARRNPLEGHLGEGVYHRNQRPHLYKGRGGRSRLEVVVAGPDRDGAREAEVCCSYVGVPHGLAAGFAHSVFGRPGCEEVYQWDLFFSQCDITSGRTHLFRLSVSAAEALAWYSCFAGTLR